MRYILSLAIYITLIEIIDNSIKVQRFDNKRTWTRKNSFKVILIGDTGLDSKIRLNAVSILKAMFEVVNSSAIGLLLGDNFYPEGITKDTSQERFEADFKKPFPKNAFPFPWYPILGNHDYLGDPQVQIDLSVSSGDDRWQFPAKYYIKVHNTSDGAKVKFIFLDTENLCKSDKNGLQYIWLTQELKKSNNFDWLFLVGHYPIISAGPHRVNINLKEMVQPLLEHFRVTAYISGHNHNMFYTEYKKIGYITSGAGSKNSPFQPWYENENSDPFKHYELVKSDKNYMSDRGAGFSTLEINKDACIIRFIQHDGRTAYGTYLDPRI